MTILNWIPELFILTQFALILGGACFRVSSSHLLIFLSGALSFVGFLYYGFRLDLLNFDSPLEMLLSDSVARSFRLFSLFFVAAGAWKLILNQNLSVVAKYRGMMGLISGAFFLSLLAQSNHWASTYIGITGLILSGMNLVLVESESSAEWIKNFRRTSLSLLYITAIFSILFFVGEHITGSGSISEWLSRMPNEPVTVQMMAGFLLLFLLFWLLHGFHVVGCAPMALPFYALAVTTSAALFWIRVGAPYFAQLELIPKIVSQSVLGLIVASASLRYSLAAARTLKSVTWLINCLSALFTLTLYPLLLPATPAFQIYYALLLGTFLTALLLGRAFWVSIHRNPRFSVLVLFVCVGLPPLSVGYQYYLLIKELNALGLAPFAISLLISWFLISVAAVQMIARVLRDKKVEVVQPVDQGHSRDWSLLGFVVLCVVVMTAFGSHLIARLITQPIPNLW